MDSRIKKDVKTKAEGLKFFKCDIRKCALFLNTKTQALQKGGKWILMLTLCVPILGLSVWIMLEGLNSKGSIQLLRPESIEIGRPYIPIMEVGDEQTKEQIILPVLKNYWIIRDSLEEMGDGRWDSFLSKRPGLLDTIKILEAMVIPQRDTLNQ